ncbi:SLC16A12 [Branchiostoma lanceolatum]|uniref:SLC16A12 protein n=1 Tax=Branchiostoma lanceolatum TaxID=7740 RepID=A0A8K0A927_BRALA|nr:SLC16A12 [Branchiostoma lanceolatum]
MPVRYTRPLDGGWGWAVVLAVFMIGACSFGVIRSFGVFLEEFTTQFDQSATATSLVISVCIGIAFGGTLLGVMLSARFGFRPVAMAGGVMAAVGCILTYFSTSIVHLYITVGVMVGLGSSLAFFPSLSLVGKYFDKKRAIANGIAVSGPSVGSMVFPPVFTYLIEEYGWRGSLLIAAGVMLNITAFAALLRPIQLPEKQLSLPSDRAETTSFSELNEVPQDRPTVRINEGKSSLSRSHWRTVIAELKALLTNPRLVSFITADMFFLGFGFFIPVVHIAPRARHLGIEPYQSAFLVSLIAIGDVISRFLSGFLPTCRKFRHLHWYTLSLLTTGISSLLSTLAKTYPALAAYCMVLGLLEGAGLAISLTVLADLVGPTRLSGAMGLVMLLMSVSVTGAPPIAGKLYDSTQNYNISFIVAGCGPILGGLIAAILLCFGDENVRRVSERQSPSTAFVNGARPNSVVKSDDKQLLKPFVIETSV